MSSFWLICGLLVFLLAGCGSATRPPTPAQSLSATPQPTNPIPSAAVQGSVEGSALSVNRQDSTDLERLTRLWQTRTQGGPSTDYPIGSGDVLEISVPAMEEIQAQTVRVSGEGTIGLPLIGVVQVGGLTEAEIREELKRRLEERYMYNPQVNIFVREYRSRQVAVVGAVDKPGLYSLASDTDTLLDVLSLAGGVTSEAAPRILFIPAGSGEEKNSKALAAALPVSLDSRDSSPPVLKGTDPIVIDLQNLANGGNQISLTLPARPGDVLVVPASGEVLVGGWVQKPASYKISPGMTVLGAVTAAGGLLYAADASTVQVIRTGKEGEKVLLAADLEKIKGGENPDIPVQAGDVIEVSSSSVKLVPYGVYSFFSNIIRIGASAPLF